MTIKISKYRIDNINVPKHINRFCNISQFHIVFKHFHYILIRVLIHFFVLFE